MGEKEGGGGGGCVKAFCASLPQFRAVSQVCIIEIRVVLCGIDLQVCATFHPVFREPRFYYKVSDNFFLLISIY